MNKQLKKILIVAGILVGALLMLWVGTLLQRLGKTEVEIVVVPEQSVLTINDSNANPGRHFLSSGSYTLRASLEHFEDDVVEIHTNDITPGQTIYLMPNPESEEAIQWLIDNNDAQMEREAIGGLKAVEQQEYLAENFPILSQLPRESLNYKIDFGINNDELVFHITLYTYILRNHEAEYRQQLKEFKNEALKWLRDNDINPEDHDITYTPAEAKDL